MKYDRKLHYERRRRTRRRIRRLLYLLPILAAVGACYLMYQNFQASNFNSDEETTTQATSTYIAPTVQIFRSPYFEFQAPKGWSEDPGSPKSPTKFVYRSAHDGVLEQTLTIYINTPGSSQAVPYILEVDAPDNRNLKVAKLSDHCGKVTKFNNSSFVTTLDKVTFKCFGDDTRYNVMVGKINGTTDLKLTRPDGTTAVYTIFYTNVTVTPNADQLTEIINSFQTR